MTAESAWDRYVAADNRRQLGRYTPPRLVVRRVSPGELAEWRRWAREGRLPQVAVEILGALLAERGEDA